MQGWRGVIINRSSFRPLEREKERERERACMLHAGAKIMSISQDKCLDVTHIILPLAYDGSFQINRSIPLKCYKWYFLS